MYDPLLLVKDIVYAIRFLKKLLSFVCIVISVLMISLFLKVTLRTVLITFFMTKPSSAKETVVLKNNIYLSFCLCNWAMFGLLHSQSYAGGLISV